MSLEDVLLSGLTIIDRVVHTRVRQEVNVNRGVFRR